MRLYKLICAYEIRIGLVNLWGKASVNPCVRVYAYSYMVHDWVSLDSWMSCGFLLAAFVRNYSLGFTRRLRYYPTQFQFTFKNCTANEFEGIPETISLFAYLLARSGSGRSIQAGHSYHEAHAVYRALQSTKRELRWIPALLSLMTNWIEFWVVGDECLNAVGGGARQGSDIARTI
jgi:hypothetical protein